MYARVAISESAVLTLRLDPKLKKQLDRLSKSVSRSRSLVAAEATRGFVALNGWQIEEIKKENEEADRGEFATEAEVEKSLKRWTRRVRVRWLRAALSNLDAEAD
jgi:predicted transcriptional regulator